MKELERQLHIASRVIGRVGLAYACGHCSLRVDETHDLVSPVQAAR